MNECISLIKGMDITGEWQNNTYKILKKVGEHGSGQIYRVYNSVRNSIYILKISNDFSVINKEHTILKNLPEKYLQLKKYIPRVYEQDMFLLGGNRIYFFVQEYVFGSNLGDYIRNNGKISNYQLIEIGRVVCETLKCLDEMGFIHGDLKPDNVIIDLYKRQLKIVSFEGVVSKGKNIKAFTPQFDRASWGTGSRKGEFSYGLFSFGMLLYVILTGESIIPHKHSDKQRLFQLLGKRELYTCWQNIISRAWRGTYRNWSAVEKDLKAAYHFNVVPLERISQQQKMGQQRYIARVIYFIGAGSAVFFFISYMITH